MKRKIDRVMAFLISIVRSPFVGRPVWSMKMSADGTGEVLRRIAASKFVLRTL
jgi:hypothetical protein